MEPHLHKIHEQAYHRGTMLDYFAAIEIMMNLFIAKHYSPKWSDFIEEILENENFSMQLRKDVFHTLLNKYYGVTDKDFPFSKLDRLQKLRNIIAHGTRRLDINPDAIDTARYGEPYFTYRGEKVLIVELEKEFEEKRKIVMESLEKLPGIKGLLSEDKSFKKVSVQFTEDLS